VLISSVPHLFSYFLFSLHLLSVEITSTKINEEITLLFAAKREVLCSEVLNARALFCTFARSVTRFRLDFKIKLRCSTVHPNAQYSFSEVNWGGSASLKVRLGRHVTLSQPWFRGTGGGLLETGGKLAAFCKRWRI
jgi:hypothetical protein